MSRSRIIRSLAAASLGVALLSACSAESLTERAASFGLEQAIEGDQDIDLDFSDEGGGFSISTEEGDFSLNFDEDNGGIVFNTEEGDGVISFDEDGIVFNTDEGDGTISFDQENGSIVFDTDQGDGEITFDEENGNVTFQTEDGELGIFNSQEIPPTWPQGLGVPATLVPDSENFSVLDLGDTVITTGVFNHDANEAYAATAFATLAANGWTEVSSLVQDGTVFAQLTNDAGQIVQVIGDDTGYTTISVTQPQ